MSLKFWSLLTSVASLFFVETFKYRKSDSSFSNQHVFQFLTASRLTTRPAESSSKRARLCENFKFVSRAGQTMAALDETFSKKKKKKKISRKNSLITYVRASLKHQTCFIVPLWNKYSKAGDYVNCWPVVEKSSFIGTSEIYGIKLVNGFDTVHCRRWNLF